MKNNDFQSEDSNSNKNYEEHIIDWNTYFRRNIHRFIEMYFGIKLHFYQKVMIYLMHKSPLVVLICSRAVSKSFITTLYASAVCVLYPGTKVVVCALTKGQASLIVKEKLKKELMVWSPNLEREIKEIKTSANETEAIFKNGSSLIASVSGEGARGVKLSPLYLETNIY